jgi:CDP-paratose 2-epimerase
VVLGETASENSNVKTLLVTGSSGLIGSEVVDYFCKRGWRVFGFDNNMRAEFFGPSGDTRWNQRRIETLHPTFSHVEIDIRDRAGVDAAFARIRPNAIVHAAAQPSHDLAASRPFVDFDVNAVGTLNLLESTRKHCADSPFVFMSTNKVYGDSPNRIPLVERDSRWDYADPAFGKGIAENLPIDQSKHSVFGASKAAADLMVQEYGRYFGMKTCCLRGGCLTGPNHSGVELHGFLSYLTRCNIEQRCYRIYGYGGKQVRDNIHSLDVARFIDLFLQQPRAGEVYNIGGGRENSISILEAFDLVSARTGKPMISEYCDTARSGDHICYYSDLEKAKMHFPAWSITVPLDQIVDEIVVSWAERTGVAT